MKAIITERPDTFDRVDRVKQAVGQPVLKGDHRFWILGGPLKVLVDDVERFEVPRGFTTDGASIPAIAQVLTGWGPWEDPQRWAAIAHDWLYCLRGAPKSKADRVFRALLKSEGSPLWDREVMFLAVLIGGGFAYRADQKQGPLIYV